MEVVTVWKEPNYDLSGNDAEGNSKRVLDIYFAIDPEFKMWTLMQVDIGTGVSSLSAATPHEIGAALTANVDFNSRFQAFLEKFANGKARISIRQREQNLRFYIANGRAETVLGFNQRAGLAQLPSYFTHDCESLDL
jgi:hypothetical protein